jgi:hypothetical protein
MQNNATLVPGGGIEPPQGFRPLRILSPLRLPISPSRLASPHDTLGRSHHVNIAQALHSCQFVFEYEGLTDPWDA